MWEQVGHERQVVSGVGKGRGHGWGRRKLYGKMFEEMEKVMEEIENKEYVVDVRNGANEGGGERGKVGERET